MVVPQETHNPHQREDEMSTNAANPDTLVTTQPDTTRPDSTWRPPQEPGLEAPGIDPIDAIGAAGGKLIVKGVKAAAQALGLNPIIQAAKNKLKEWWDENKAEEPEAETEKKQ